MNGHIAGYLLTLILLLVLLSGFLKIRDWIARRRDAGDCSVVVADPMCMDDQEWDKTVTISDAFRSQK